MDIKALSYFIVVAEELNITRAAKILNMAQPPLSYQMKALEEELGTVLFIRGKRHLTLTESGKYLYQKSKDIVGLVDSTKNEIRNINQGLKGTISIGLVEGVAPGIAANWISESLNQYPNVHFRLIDGNSDDLLEKMRSGLISLAVITSPYDAVLLNALEVGEENLQLFINKEHKLASQDKPITINDLINEPIIVPNRKSHSYLIKKWFRKTSGEANIVCEVDNYLDAVALAEKNVGISVFPNTGVVSNNEIVCKNIEGVENSIKYLFVWRKGHKLSTIEENFIDYIKELYGRQNK